MSEQTYMIDDLKRLRDEVRVKMHLASMDARAEWDRLETKWKDFSARAELSKTGVGLDSALRSLGDELTEGYRRVRNAVAQRRDAGDGEGQGQIAERAYQLWEARGRPNDSPEQDWLAAEKEMAHKG